MSSRAWTVACFAGDGVGPELMAETSRVLAEVARLHALHLNDVHLPFGGEALAVLATRCPSRRAMPTAAPMPSSSPLPTTPPSRGCKADLDLPGASRACTTRCAAIWSSSSRSATGRTSLRLRGPSSSRPARRTRQQRQHARPSRCPRWPTRSSTSCRRSTTNVVAPHALCSRCSRSCGAAAGGGLNVTRDAARRALRDVGRVRRVQGGARPPDVDAGR